ncbi:MAG: hypothetical protein MI861_17180, partial [Pirellulales bacterium]|nr:hypothetical protein [Pirellulales bacterium]
LNEVIRIADVKTEIDKSLRSLADQDRLAEINSMTPQEFLEAWTDDSNEMVPRMVSRYTEIHQPTAKATATELYDLANALRCLSKPTLSSQKDLKQAQEDLKRAREGAEKVLENAVGLSPQIRANLNRFIDLSGKISYLNKKSFGDAEIELLEALDRQLVQCAWALADKALVNFRNNPQVARFIGAHALDSSLKNLTAMDLYGMKPAALLSQRNSNARMAFGIFCQATGQNEMHAVRLASFSVHLTALDQKWQNGQVLGQDIQAEAKHLLDQGVRWDSDTQKSAGKRTPRQVLTRLAKNRGVTREEVLSLAETIDKSLQKDIDAFRDYAHAHTHKLSQQVIHLVTPN